MSHGRIAISTFATYKYFLETAHGVQRVLHIVDMISTPGSFLFPANPFDAYMDGKVQFFRETSLVSIEVNKMGSASTHAAPLT